MKREEEKILQEVQKNTEMAIRTIDAIADKVFDDDLALQLSRQSLKYSQIRNAAVEKLVDERGKEYRGNHIQDMMLVGSIHANTLLNTSTSHLAEMMIQGSNRGLTHMWKSLNMHANAKGCAMEIAKEFMDFEEKNIERLKFYL